VQVWRQSHTWRVGGHKGVTGGFARSVGPHARRSVVSVARAPTACSGTGRSSCRSGRR
jgi:hypothetical protein